MYVVCVLCDVGRRHAVAFRAERRRRHVFVFLGVCIIRTSACVRVCAVLCVCTFMIVCMHVHVCARTLPPAPLEPGCVAMLVLCVVCRRQQFITCRVVVSSCVWAHDHEGL